MILRYTARIAPPRLEPPNTRAAALARGLLFHGAAGDSIPRLGINSLVYNLRAVLIGACLVPSTSRDPSRCRLRYQGLFGIEDQPVSYRVVVRDEQHEVREQAE